MDDKRKIELLEALPLSEIRSICEDFEIKCTSSIRFYIIKDILAFMKKNIMNDIQISERIRAAYMLTTTKLKQEVRQVIYRAKNIPPGNIKCSKCSDISNLSPIIQCATCGCWYHCECIKIPQSFLSKPSYAIQNGKWNCKYCYDNNVDPFNQLQHYLSSFMLERNYLITQVTFNITQQNLKHIIDNKYSIIIRLYDIFNGNDKIDYDNIIVLINGQTVRINETRLYKFLKSDTNYLQFRYKTIPSNVIYCGSVLCTKSYRVNQLIQLVRSSKYVRLPNSLKFVRSFFKSDDDGANLVHLDISTHCPLGLTRIQTPVRGIYCKHIQCFDLYNYLSLNNINSKWICPVCNRCCPFTQIIIDPFYDEILKSNGEIIRIKPDGSWIVQEQEEIDEDEENDLKEKEKRKIEVIDIDDDDENENENNKEENGSNIQPNKIRKVLI